MPIAVLLIPRERARLSSLIIPVVFITNDCMIKIGVSQVEDLAEKMILLIKNIATMAHVEAIPEIQIDCDWTAGTKDKYFQLLQTIRNSIAGEKIILSATVRLYQYKYYQKNGIPPVDRGLLMCYNMGNLKNPDTRNSILEPKELKKYMDGLPGYSLPLDIALPIFGWKVLFRNKKYAGLINDLPSDLLKGNPALKQTGNKFDVLHSGTINGFSFQTGDVIRDEEVSYDELIKAENILTEKVQTQHFSVVLYHLDSITLSKFTTHELETVFDYLH